ncbi:restriction endonuclease subunit S [Flavobacterium sp. IMCC34518]|uniref:restriction endonuclease subunit S n=1 Tax=Flavobacterium sp. IMCC34518 TaxID=3003623 RepID=UPI0022AC18FE|nr:restriction endonuclease subunit S [Flavobacterium sp. IMCC34518]
MMSNQNNIPQLRFSGFEGEWKQKRLGEIAKITTGSTPSTLIEEYYNGEKLFVSPADIQGNRYVFNTKTTLTESGFSKGRKIVKGSVLFVCIGSTIGKIAQASEECLTNQQINALNANKEYENDFIYELLDKNGTKIKLLAGVQAVPQINKTDFSNFKYFLPTLPEQQKIASFLSAVDEKIQQLSRKKELLEQYKKGVMQRLFSGKLRFKDENGEDYPDWEEKKLGDVGKIVTGKTPSTTDSNLWNGDIQFITPTDIKDGIKYQTSTERYVANNDKIKILPRNSIIYTCIASIGKMCISKFPSITNQQINSLVVDEDNNFEYVYYWLLYLTPYIKTTQANTTLPIINKTDFSKFSISVPSAEEQQKIANFLSSIDTKIENVNGEIVKTQLFKKGLLQQMFV